MKAENVKELAKCYYDVENARKRIELLCKDRISPDAKNLLKRAENRLQWAITDLKTSLPRESAAIFHKQVCNWETLSFSAVYDEMLLMSEEQRAQFELIAKAFRKGEIELLQVEENELEAA